MITLFTLVLALIPGMILGLSVGATADLILQTVLTSLVIIIWPVTYINIGRRIRPTWLLLWILASQIPGLFIYF